MGTWSNQGGLQARSFRCGHCGDKVASNGGWTWGGVARVIYVCPLCERPNYFEGTARVPDELPGNEVANLPENVEALYREIRRCISVGAHTASVVTARKLLASMAVGFGASENQNFVQHVEFLASAGYVPPNGKPWVDHIRKKGNEAAHEIYVMQRADAEELVVFLEMLLKFAYEFPARVPKSP